MADSSGMRAGLKGNVEEALRLFASEAEWGGLNLAETEFVLEETLKCYGSTFDGEMIRSLFAFYRRYLGMADVARRQRLLSRMTEFISSGHQPRHVALLCFISADTDGQITSGAALDLAMVTPPDKGDPLTGPKLVAFHGCGGVRAKLGKPGSDDEGDVAAGLLLLGDMRLLPLLEEIWARLTPEGRRRMVQRRSNLVSAVMIEFLLRRLEADKEEEYFGELGAALHNLPAIAAQQPINAVLDIRRNFGLPPGKEPMELLSHEDIPTAFARFRPRLQALIDRESGPIKVLNATISVWAEAAGWSQESEAEDEEEVEEDDGLDDEDDIETFPNVSSEELRDEFLKISSELDPPSEVMAYCNPYDVRDVTPDELAQEFAPQSFFPLLVTGIFNPFGPTVCVYGVQKSGPFSWSIVNFQLNPFSCTKGMIALLDEEKVSFDPGEFDIEESRKRVSFVSRGRTTPSLDVAHEVITKVVLAESKLLTSFTLCVASARVSKAKSLERMTLVYQSLPKARQDLDDLRDKKKRNDPWARADMEEIMKRVANPGPDPLPLSADEAKELARLVSSLEQQRIEMTNLQAAWEGATDFSPLTPVMTREQLLKALVLLAPDMPNLLNHKGPFYPDDLTADVPGGMTKNTSGTTTAAPTAGLAPAKAVERVKDMDSPAGEERTMSPAEKIAAAMATPPEKKDETTVPKFDGLLGCLGPFTGLELMLGFWAIVWALICTEWVLALALACFFFLQFLKVMLITSRIAWSRWFAVFNYGWVLAYLVYRIDRHNTYAQPMTGAGLLLVQIMTITAGVMGFIYLSYFRFAKTMREAPEVKN